MSDKPSQATELVALAEMSFRFGVSADGMAFGEDETGPRVALPLRGGGGVRGVMADLYFQNHGRVPSGQALSDALAIVEAKCHKKDREPVALRVAEHEDGIIIDRGTAAGAAIVVRPGSWRQVARSPVLFRRTALTGALWDPPHGEGDLELLRTLLNVSDVSWPMLVGWLVATLLPSVPKPVVLFTGEQGTGKTSAARQVVSLVDPGPAPVRSAPRNPDDWTIAAAGSQLVCLDNVSSIKDWLSDAICKAVTGDGLVRRALYTDTGLSVVSYRRSILLTSIDPGALRGDLAERLLPLELERISERERRTDAEMQATFATIAPIAFAGLLDLTAEVLAVLPGVRLEAMPRMADFARVLAAVDQIKGTESADTFMDTAKNIAAEVVAGDAVAEAITRHAGFVGTASELLATITPERPPKDWPTSPKALSGILKRAVPALRQVGVTVEFERANDKTRTRTITITAASDSRSDGASIRPLRPAMDGADATDAPAPMESGDPEVFDTSAYEGPYADMFPVEATP